MCISVQKEPATTPSSGRVPCRGQTSEKYIVHYFQDAIENSGGEPFCGLALLESYGVEGREMIGVLDARKLADE